MLEDVQDRCDDRQLPIGEVGISGIRYPVAVWDREHGRQNTVAEVSMSVDLRPDVKGAHLSRFVEILHDCAGELSPHAMPVILDELRQRLGSHRAQFRADFPYFMQQNGPGDRLSGTDGLPMPTVGPYRGQRYGSDPGRAGTSYQRLSLQQGDQRLRSP